MPAAPTSVRPSLRQEGPSVHRGIGYFHSSGEMLIEELLDMNDLQVTDLEC